MSIRSLHAAKASSYESSRQINGMDGGASENSRTPAGTRRARARKAPLGHPQPPSSAGGNYSALTSGPNAEPQDEIASLFVGMLKLLGSVLIGFRNAILIFTVILLLGGYALLKADVAPCAATGNMANSGGNSATIKTNGDSTAVTVVKKLENRAVTLKRKFNAVSDIISKK